MLCLLKGQAAFGHLPCALFDLEQCKPCGGKGERSPSGHPGFTSWKCQWFNSPAANEISVMVYPRSSHGTAEERDQGKTRSLKHRFGLEIHHVELTFLPAVFLNVCFSWFGCCESSCQDAASPQTPGAAQGTEPISQHQYSLSIMLDFGYKLFSGFTTDKRQRVTCHLIEMSLLLQQGTLGQMFRKTKGGKDKKRRKASQRSP